LGNHFDKVVTALFQNVNSIEESYNQIIILKQEYKAIARQKIIHPYSEQTLAMIGMFTYKIIDLIEELPIETIRKCIDQI